MGSFEEELRACLRYFRKGENNVARRRTHYGSFKGSAGSIRLAVDHLFNRRRLRNRMLLSHDEHLALFVAPELHAAYRTVASTAILTSAQTHKFKFGNGNGGNIEIEISLHREGDRAPLVPRHRETGQGLAPTAPPALLERITSWVTERWELGKEFSLVGAVIDRLDAMCMRPEHVRFYFPSIVTLLELVAVPQELSERLNTPMSKDAPALPPELRRALRTTAATVAGAALLTDVDDDPRYPPAEMEFPSYAPDRNFESELGRIHVR